MYKYKSVIVILILLLCVGMVGGLFSGGSSSSGGTASNNKVNTPSKDPSEETTKKPTEATTQAPKETTAAPEKTTEAPDETTAAPDPEVPTEVGNWRIVISEYAYCTKEDLSDKTSIESPNTSNNIGNTLCHDGVYYSSITANRILLGNSYAAVEGFEISDMNAKIYAADGTLLDTTEVYVEALSNDASVLGYEDTVLYSVYDNDYIDLTAYAGQTVTVIYEVSLVGTEQTVEVIELDVNVPGATEETTVAPEETTETPETTEAPEETTEAPEVDVFALEPGLYSSELNTTTPIISWNSLVEQGAVVVTDGAVTPVAGLLPVGNLVLPNDGSVTTIGPSAFANCEALTGILIPDAVTSIGMGAFSSCTDLENVFIGNGVKSISDNAFNGCSNLQRVYLGAGIESLGSSVFYNCSSLAEIHVSDLAAFCGISTNDNLFPFFKNNFTTLCVNGEAVTDLVIPESVTKIGSYVFAGLRTIKSLEIGSNVTSIGVYAFDNCTALETVKMSSGSFGLGTFNSCNVIKVFDLSGCTSVLRISSPYYPPSIGTSTIYVPADLYDEWIAAENWCDIADRIVAVEDGQVPAYLNELD